jgi:uncharacterized protein YeaO (DUF488 family)
MLDTRNVLKISSPLRKKNHLETDYQKFRKELTEKLSSGCNEVIPKLKKELKKMVIGVAFESKSKEVCDKMIADSDDIVNEMLAAMFSVYTNKESK